MARWIQPSTRLAILERDGWTCAYCGAELHADTSASFGFRAHGHELDHVVCRSAGGSNKHTNLVAACPSCNNARRDTPLKEWAGIIARKRAESAVSAIGGSAEAVDIMTAALAKEVLRTVRNRTRRVLPRERGRELATARRAA